MLWCAKVAKRYLEAGFTSCVGAACAKPRLDVVIRNAINAGQIPGPRYLAASQEITVVGGLGDETLPHLPFPEFSFGVNISGRRRDAQGRAPVPEVRRRLDQAQPLGRQLHAAVAVRDDLDDRRGGRGGDARGAHPRQARHRPRALVRERQAGASSRHRPDLPRELRRRGGARHARGRQGPGLRRARHRDPLRDAARGRGLRRHPGHGHRDGLPGRVGRGARVALEDAPARHPRAAGRRLRLRVHAALPERARPRVLRQVPRLHADGGDPLDHALRRPDHDEAGRARRRSRTATSPTCCSSTATRSPTCRSCATRSGCSR